VSSPGSSKSFPRFQFENSTEIRGKLYSLAFPQPLNLGSYRDQYGPWHYPAKFLACSLVSSRVNNVTAESSLILSWLQQRVEEIAALLADLVAIPTENPPGNNYRACVDLLETHMRKAHLDCERLGPGVLRRDIEDCPESMLATHGRGERRSIFTGTTTLCPHKRRRNFSLFGKNTFCLGAAPRT
jgi:hypothetical protein